MRHRKRGRKLNRTPAHRKALLRNLTNSLFKNENNRIKTTLAKAKEVRPFAEKLITLAKVKTLHRYRRALSILQDEASVSRLFSEIGPSFAERPGGYLRILRWPHTRLGDNAPQAFLELVSDEEVEPTKKKKRRRKKVAVSKSTSKKAVANEPEESVAEPEVGEDAVAVEETPEDPKPEEGSSPDEADDAEEKKE